MPRIPLFHGQTDHRLLEVAGTPAPDVAFTDIAAQTIRPIDRAGTAVINGSRPAPADKVSQ